MTKFKVAKKPCKRCGGYERYVVSRACTTCAKRKARRWRRENPERHKKRMAEWYLDNREYVAKRTRAWQLENPEKCCEMAQRHRARKLGVEHEEYSRDDIMSKHPRCLACYSVDSLQLDHVVPVSLGGPDKESNLQVLCKPCNSSKNATYREYRPQYLLAPVP